MNTGSRTSTVDTSSFPSRERFEAHSDLREDEGMLTFAETAERYGVTIDALKAAYSAGTIVTVTFQHATWDEDVTLVATRQPAFAKWLEAQTGENP